jgi:hypothetical protein
MMAAECWIGIDPGTRGGLVVLAERSGHVELRAARTYVSELAEYEFLSDLREGYGGRWRAFLEHVEPRPPTHRKACFALGQSRGMWRTLLAMLRIPYDEIRPQAWMRAVRAPHRQKGDTDTRWKRRLEARARELYPVEVFPLELADAVLLAEACRRAELNYKMKDGHR